jgi:hypothetical protein
VTIRDGKVDIALPDLNGLGRRPEPTRLLPGHHAALPVLVPVDFVAQ